MRAVRFWNRSSASRRSQASSRLTSSEPLLEVVADSQGVRHDREGRAHDVDNLYVVDGSFFPSSAAVNPALTIMANALRVGDHLMERLR